MKIYRVCYNNVGNYLWIVAENFKNVEERAKLILGESGYITDITLMGDAHIDYRCEKN